MGRPRKIQDESIHDEILEDVSKGMSLKKACEKRNIGHWVFHTDIRSNESLKKRYEEAKLQGYHLIADEILDLCDAPLDPNGGRDQVAHRRLMVETRKWMLAKSLPKFYGDKIDLNHGNQDGSPLILEIQRKIINTSDKKDG